MLFVLPVLVPKVLSVQCGKDQAGDRNASLCKLPEAL